MIFLPPTDGRKSGRSPTPTWTLTRSGGCAYGESEGRAMIDALATTIADIPGVKIVLAVWALIVASLIFGDDESD
jgi:hypothetical protein